MLLVQCPTEMLQKLQWLIVLGLKGSGFKVQEVEGFWHRIDCHRAELRAKVARQQVGCSSMFFELHLVRFCCCFSFEPIER